MPHFTLVREDGLVEKFKKLWSFMNISYDRYVRTTDQYHIETVQNILTKLHDKGFIYKGNSGDGVARHGGVAMSDVRISGGIVDGGGYIIFPLDAIFVTHSYFYLFFYNLIYF